MLLMMSRHCTTPYQLKQTKLPTIHVRKSRKNLPVADTRSAVSECALSRSIGVGVVGCSGSALTDVSMSVSLWSDMHRSPLLRDLLRTRFCFGDTVPATAACLDSSLLICCYKTCYFHCCTTYTCINHYMHTTQVYVK